MEGYIIKRIICTRDAEMTVSYNFATGDAWIRKFRDLVSRFLCGRKKSNAFRPAYVRFNVGNVNSSVVLLIIAVLFMARQ